MAKSQETYSKKERENKRLKKRKEKEEKRLERKANNNKGKSFEDMIAYVDENGKLSSTPPDPAKRKAINLDDIQLGARKVEEVNPADLIRKGNVTFFNGEKGYGFIRDEKSQESIFFHINSVNGTVKEKDKVSFEVEMGPKGANAVRVSIVA
ncbi:MAG: cold shock domain-containing protein [Bacteroidia bacterium]|nr:cold shock domain-containing protein [Bacteroidia bacterium]